MSPRFARLSVASLAAHRAGEGRISLLEIPLRNGLNYTLECVPKHKRDDSSGMIGAHPLENLPMRPIRLALCLALAPGLVLAACGPKAEDTTAAAQSALGPRVENAELGLALAHLPAGFEVETNEGGELVLARSDAQDPARLTFELGPVQSSGVNLVERVWEEKARIESLPDGQYRGQNELGGVPLGTTFTSRGRFRDEAGERVEEYRALLVHPTQNRVLVLDFEYPVPPPDEAEKSHRLEQLMLVLEQVEPAGGGGETEPPAEPQDAASTS